VLLGDRLWLTVVASIKAAGAVVLGKTAMPDFATSWFSYSSVTGTTKNPYALDRDPGGSSSGTGASIAASLGMVGIGEDTGGSIRLPASFCNLVGVRVTPGLISRTGLSPLVVFQDAPARRRNAPGGLTPAGGRRPGGDLRHRSCGGRPASRAVSVTRVSATPAVPGYWAPWVACARRTRIGSGRWRACGRSRRPAG
jgi:hypothetical protein